MARASARASPAESVRSKARTSSTLPRSPWEPPPARHSPAPPEAEALLLSLARDEPRLAAMTRRKATKWAPLAARWLERGLSHEQICETLTSGLDKVRSPLGVLLRRLTNCLPEAQPSPPPPTRPRVERMRECAGRGHTHPRLFTPRADEHECPSCTGGTARPHPPGSAQGPGFRAYLQARRDTARASAARATAAVSLA